ncbi:hypothetical protein EUTSA_v10028483mg [Eutrema salsugineum]|uniref:Uncharacterized protein n=1 Tax=Eutrema salsugineum TaxID=72664 RepID=V4L871_EUTSA|nr:uncharacterized protein LOC18014743 isoform X2 [Eutrema salsugineum]ESQ38512.1 hypothetical protein EUTSA_v10028483mg [Eutrema salsugineum]
MKQCDHGLSPFASPFAIGSSSLSFPASESDPEDSFWRDFAFDFSFLTSDDQKNGLEDDIDSLSNLSRPSDSTTVPKAEESELYGLRRSEKSASFVKLPNVLESDLKCFDSKPRISPSLAMDATSDSRALNFPKTASVLGVSSISPVAKNATVASEGLFRCAKDNEVCSREVLVSKDSNSSPLFSKMLKSCIPCDQDEDAEVDSPCWKGTRSHNTAASGTTKSLSFRRSTDDLNILYGLNPLAPQFIPSNAKKNLDDNGKEFEENCSSSLKKSLSSTFLPSSGEFSVNDPSDAGIEQDSRQKNSIGILFNDADESLGLVSQVGVSKTMSLLEISNQFQTPKRLDPLAPVFVPANAKEKHGAADDMIAIETNAHSAYALSSSDDLLLNRVKVETHSSEVGHSFRNPYSNSVHQLRKTYSLNPRLGSQVQISENTKLDPSSNKSHCPKKLNPLAPQFSLADTKPKVYGYEKNQAANDIPPNVYSSVLFSPNGYSNQEELHAELAQSSMHGRLRPNILHGNSSPQMDVTKLLTTIHGLSELLTHVHSSGTSDSPNEQDLDLINCTVQNLKSYINNRNQQHSGKYSSALHSSCDSKLLPNMSKAGGITSALFLEDIQK